MATTTKIIVYPLTISFNMFGGSNWYSSSYQSSSTNLTTEQAGLGRTTGDVYRATVLKFTTPSTFKSGITNKKLTVRFSARSNSSTATNSGTFYYRISKTGPSFTTASAQFPAAGASGVFAGTTSITFTTSYKRFEITTSAHDFTANTTYYMWLISEPPKGGAMGYVQNNTTSRIELDFECTDTITYTKINAYGLAHHNGFYSGAKVAIKDTDGNLFTSGYAYCNWAGRGSSFYAQKVENNSNWSRFQYGFALDANTTTTTNYRTLYAFYAPQSLGNPITYYPKGFITTYNVPRFACNIYCGTSTPTLFVSTSSTTATPSAVSGYTCTGVTSSATGTMPTLTSPITLNANRDGGTYYAIYTQSSEMYYYRGTATEYSTDVSKILYGTGRTTWSVTEPTKTCLADSNYSFVGWAANSNKTGINGTLLVDCAKNGFKRVYGVYEKAGGVISSSLASLSLALGSSSVYVPKTVTATDAYIYGTGLRDGGITTTTYGDVDTTCTSNSSATLIGWNTYSTSYQVQYSNYKQGFEAGHSHLYGIYALEENITYYGVDAADVKVLTTTNYYHGGGHNTNNIPEEPSLTKTNWKLAGWGTTSTDITPDTWATLWNNGTRTVYAIWVPDNHIYFGNSSWKKPKIYYGVNGIWKPAVVRTGVNSTWK